jgi:hypothetical protein
MASFDRSPDQQELDGARQVRSAAPWWRRWLFFAWNVAAAVGILYLLDPLLLCIVPSAALFLVMLLFTIRETGLDRLRPARGVMLFGAITLFLAYTLVPVCWATWPIRHSGGQVEFDGSLMDTLLEGTRTPCKVSLRGSKITDATLGKLHDSLIELGGIKVLDLSESRITDGGLVHIQDVNFHELHLVNTQVADRGLEILGRSGVAATLRLDSTQITDAGLAHLKRYPRLYRLDLNHTQVGDTGLAKLKELRGLRGLFLNGTLVTDSGLAELRELPNIAWLGLRDSRVSDTGLEHLSGMKRLYHLDLGNTAVSDTGLLNLKGLQSLNWLGLHQTNVTDAGIAGLKRTLPRLTVVK